MFTDKQQGFRNKRSTMLELLQVMNQWMEKTDSGECFDVLYLDFIKAFDTVPHVRMPNKLSIDGNVLDWIADFLKGRCQRVSVTGNYSCWMNVLSGIPQ